MENPILPLEIISLKALEDFLKGLPEEFNRDQPVALNLFGPQILVRQFDLPRLTKREIKNAIRLEATEAFSLLPEEIEVDYQILDSSKEKTRGVFAALPKKLLDDYMLLLNQARLAPAKISANIFSRINHFLQENKSEEKNFCVIDFYKDNIINMAVFDNAECKLLREIPYETLSDAEREIEYSLKYTSGKSMNKQIGEIHVLGDLANKEGIIANLKANLNTDIKPYNIEKPLNDEVTSLFFNIDLIKDNGIPASLRKKILSAANVILIISLLSFLTLIVMTVSQGRLIKNLSASYKPSDYKLAQDMQIKMNSLKNAK